MTIRTLGDCLRVFHDDPTMFECTYAIFLGGGRSRQTCESSERQREVNSGTTPPCAPCKQQLDTEPDKYKRITSRKIIVIAFFLLFFTSFFVVATVTVAFVTFWYFSTFIALIEFQIWLGSKMR